MLDADGWAGSVTTSNGEGSGVLVPGTGLHMNNMLGEQDLSPLGFFSAPPGSRLPSAMAPTLVRRDGELELVLGSAGSNRIRSALLQVIVNTVDLGLPVQAAVDAPRLHAEDGVVAVEPGIDTAALAGGRAPDHPVPRPEHVLRRVPGGGQGGPAARRGRRSPPRRRRRGRAHAGPGRTP